MPRIFRRSSRPATFQFRLLTLLMLFALATPPVALRGEDGEAKAVAVTSEVTELLIAGADRRPSWQLRGKDAAAQLVVLARSSDGSLRDVTRAVSYSSSVPGICNVDETGYVTTQADGATNIVATDPQSQKSVTLALEVTNIQNELSINFANQITPIFTKYGCNSGGCHGKSGGQNGYRMSLLGFEPTDDYEWLVKEARGRRVFPASPDFSLLLQKASGSLPHGGGGRVPVDSPPYRVMRRWMEQGMPYGSKEDPVVTGIEVLPNAARAILGSSSQIAVWASYSDGHVEDVTRMTTFESNDPEMAEVSPTGYVTLGKIPGTVAVMARFQGQVGIFRATLPLGAPIAELPPERTLVDRYTAAQWKSLGLPPSAISDDATFLRRVTIDIAGRLPRIEETDAFLADASPDKRERLVERLLASDDYASAFATKWAVILRNKRERSEDRWRTFAFYQWLHDAMSDNAPIDQIVTQLLTATGTPDQNPAVGWYSELREPEMLVEDTAQLFLGQRIGCAKCHHHPQEKWSQQDYYGMAAFFTQIGRKADSRSAITRVVHRVGVAQANHPRTGQAVKPAGLGSNTMEIDPWQDPRVELAHWLTDPKNPFFAKAVVNRYWKHFMTRGLVEPEDDMRATNPASNPELLDALAQDFIEHGYDLKHLVRAICNSSTYQLSAEPNSFNFDDKSNHSRYYPKRLPAEVTLDAVDQLTGTVTNFGGLPAGTLPTQLPDNGFPSYFLTVFGRPEGNSACECERSNDASLAQCLHLINSDEVQKKLRNDSPLLTSLAQVQDSELEAAIKQMYVRAYSRQPSADELKVAADYIRSKAERRVGLEDLAWVLMNSKEFLFNH